MTDLLQNGLLGSPRSPRDSQESSPTPRFKASILLRSAFFTIQLSHPYMTIGKTTALTKWTSVGKVMFLLLNMLSRLVITFLPKSAAAAAKSHQSCRTLRPHRRQPTRLPRPGNSLGKNTGVGCHFLLQCMKGKSESEVTQSYLTLSSPMDCSLPGSSIHGIFQARVLEWGAIACSASKE